jgi:hypothetical protein
MKNVVSNKKSEKVATPFRSEKNTNALRKSGTEMVGDVPWGTHLCQFYETKEDLIDILVPYFAEGLKNNEFCMWVTSRPLGVEEARAALQKAVPDLEQYIKKGQIEILPHTDWYLLGGEFDVDRVLNGWVEKEKGALDRGFAGLRLTGNTFWIERNYWKRFVGYEAAVNDVILGHRIIAICTYSLEKCTGSDVIDVMRNHESILIRKGKTWVLAEDVLKRKRAEEALRRSEEKYRSIVELAPDGIVTVDMKGVVASCNTATTRISGFSRDEIVGKHISKLGFLRAKDIPKYLKIFGSILRGKVPEPFEIVWQSKDGTPRVADVLVSLMKKEGKTIGVQVMVRDITKRKKAEETLLAERDRLETVTRNIGAGLAIISKDYRTLWANDVLKQLFGNVEGKICYSTYNQRNEICPRCGVREIFETGKNKVVHEQMGKDVDGKTVWSEITATPTKDKDGNITAVLELVVPITERKKAEEELRKFKTISDKAGYGSAISDLEGNLVYVNESLAKMHEYTADELIGKNLSIFHTKVQMKNVNRLKEQLKQKGSYVAEEVWHRKKDSTVFPTLMNGTLIRDEEGKPLFMAATAVDITERKRMEDELRRYSAHLEELVEERTRKLKEAHEQLLKTERLAAIGELATMVAHDLRNPLTSIRNAGFYIQNSCPARATGECKTALEMLDIIDQEIIFANNIINDLLDFAAKRPLQKKKQNINNLIDDSLERIHTPENIRIERKYAKKAAVAVDEKQLERVFLNLTKNAVQAMPNGGTLTIATNETKDHFEIAFTDTGTGIPEDNMNKLFTPLFTTKAKGIGMGLAICKNIVEQHGGTIEAQSKAGQDTTFTIKLPKKEETNAQ